MRKEIKKEFKEFKKRAEVLLSKTFWDDTDCEIYAIILSYNKGVSIDVETVKRMLKGGKIKWE